MVTNSTVTETSMKRMPKSPRPSGPSESPPPPRPSGSGSRGSRGPPPPVLGGSSSSNSTLSPTTGGIVSIVIYFRRDEDDCHRVVASWRCVWRDGQHHQADLDQGRRSHRLQPLRRVPSSRRSSAHGLHELSGSPSLGQVDQGTRGDARDAALAGRSALWRVP